MTNRRDKVEVKEPINIYIGTSAVFSLEDGRVRFEPKNVGHAIRALELALKFLRSFTRGKKG